MGSAKALKDFQCTITKTNAGFASYYNRKSQTDLAESSNIDNTLLVSGQESYNSDYERMMHRSSIQMSLYNDEIIK
jgi:hypothetical protein